MNYARDDIMVREICGVLTERERSALKYRKVKDILNGQQTLLQSGVQGADKIAMTLMGANPLTGMLQLERSAKQAQLRAGNVFDRTRIPLANPFVFAPEIPIDDIMAIFENHLLTSPKGIDPTLLIENITDDVKLEIGEEMMEELMEKKEETGSYGTSNPVVDGLFEMRDALARGEAPTMGSIQRLIERAEDVKERHDIGMKTMIQMEEMSIGEALGAQDLAELQGFRSAYKERPIGQLNTAYDQKLTKEHGARATPERARILKQRGLIAPSAFSTARGLTKQDRFRIFETLWGDDYQGAMDALDKIALREQKPGEGATKALTALFEEVGEDKPTDEGEQDRNIQQD